MSRELAQLMIRSICQPQISNSWPDNFARDRLDLRMEVVSTQTLAYGPAPLGPRVTHSVCKCGHVTGIVGIVAVGGAP